MTYDFHLHVFQENCDFDSKPALQIKYEYAFSSLQRVISHIFTVFSKHDHIRNIQYTFESGSGWGHCVFYKCFLVEFQILGDL